MCQNVYKGAAHEWRGGGSAEHLQDDEGGGPAADGGGGVWCGGPPPATLLPRQAGESSVWIFFLNKIFDFYMSWMLILYLGSSFFGATRGELK